MILACRYSFLLGVHRKSTQISEGTPISPQQKIVNGDPADDAPFPDDPAIADNRAAWKALGTFDKPFLTALSDRDPVTKFMANNPLT